jgi:hypothetical protein
VLAPDALLFFGGHFSVLSAYVSLGEMLAALRLKDKTVKVMSPPTDLSKTFST